MQVDHLILNYMITCNLNLLQTVFLFFCTMEKEIVIMDVRATLLLFSVLLSG